MPIRYLTDIYFERGAIAQLPDVMQQLDIKRPLIVTDPGVIAAGLLERLDLEPVIIFSDIQTNPSETSAQAILLRSRLGRSRSGLV